MSDDELQDGEERHSDDAPLNISDDDLPEDDGMPPVEVAEDGVYATGGDDDEEDEDELDVDPELIEESY
jgi:hypothetical protein